MLNRTMNSPEYQTFKLHYQELKLGLDPASVVGSAFAKDLLTREERDAAAHPHYTEYEKLEKFLSAVDKRIVVKPDAFHTFMEVLDGEPAFNHLAEKLKETYRLLCSSGTSNGNAEAPRSAKGMKRPTQLDLLKNVKTTKWYELGLELKVDEDDLNFIERDCSQDTPGAVKQVLKKWLEQCEEPTWWNVVDALRQVGEKRRARDLEEKYC